MGHPQPQAPVHCDSATAVGIANNTIKWQRLRSMEMRLFWVGDKLHKKRIRLHGTLGRKNLAEYQSKNYNGTHHNAVRP